MRVALIIPTLNAGTFIPVLMAALAIQARKPDECLLLDSGSTDNTTAIAAKGGFAVEHVEAGEFNHGATRQLGVRRTTSDILIFMTQDAIVAAPNAISQLIACFEKPAVGAAYGRQLPRAGAGLFEAHARLLNYPERSRIVSRDDIARFGLRAAFLSDSFAAYRREALNAVGGFPKRIIMGEDMTVGAKLLLAGWKIAYCAEATVYHSHAYDWRQEYQRYFDTGVMHSRESWLLREFGGAGGEGLKFVRSECAYLCRQGKTHLLPAAFLRTMAKYAGYQLGRRERWLPVEWKKSWSMNKGYWEKEE